MTIKVSAICATPADLAELLKPEVGVGCTFSAHRGTVQSLDAVLQADVPDVLVIDVPNPDEATMQQIEVALANAHATHMVLVCPDRSVEFLMRAMRAGVREVLPSPLTAATIREVIQHAQGYPSISGRVHATVGQVLAIVQAKGGAGATFAVTSLAHALARQDKQVAVLDLNLYFGDAAMFLGNASAVSSVVDLARQTHRLDATLMLSSMIKVKKNLHVLPAPESPEHINEVTAEDIEKIIHLARSQYDFVILDVPSMLSPVSIRALDLADTLYMVMQLNLPCIRTAKLMLTVFRALGYPNSKVSLVVNRYDKSGDVALADVERATGLKVRLTIPNSHASVDAAINQGVPIFELFPRDPVSRAFNDWAQQVSPIEAAAPAKSWLQSIRKLAA